MLPSCGHVCCIRLTAGVYCVVVDKQSIPLSLSRVTKPGLRPEPEMKQEEEKASKHRIKSEGEFSCNMRIAQMLISLRQDHRLRKSQRTENECESESRKKQKSDHRPEATRGPKRSPSQRRDWSEVVSRRASVVRERSCDTSIWKNWSRSRRTRSPP